MTDVYVFKSTTDDWHPSFELKDGAMLVQVSFSKWDDGDGFHVSVWGDDDCGMELDTENENQAFNIFLQVIGMEFVNMKPLRDLGFKSA